MGNESLTSYGGNDVYNLRASILKKLNPDKIADKLARICDSADDKVQIQALKLVSELINRDDKEVDAIIWPAVVFGLKNAKTVGEIEELVIGAGIKKTNAPAFVRRVAKSEGLPLPHERLAAEQEARRQSVETDDFKAYEDLRTMLIQESRTATKSEDRIRAAERLIKLCEFDTEVFHKARKTAAMGEKSDEEVAAILLKALTGK